MTGLATYNEALLTDTDRARALLGDTDTASALFSNAHIEAVIALQGGLRPAVAVLAEELIAMFARDPVRKSADGVMVDYSDRLDIWRGIASTARLSASGGGLSFVPATYTGVPAEDEWARPPNYWP